MQRRIIRKTPLARKIRIILRRMSHKRILAILALSLDSHKLGHSKSKERNTWYMAYGKWQLTNDKQEYEYERRTLSKLGGFLASGPTTLDMMIWFVIWSCSAAFLSFGALSSEVLQLLYRLAAMHRRRSHNNNMTHDSRLTTKDEVSHSPWSLITKILTLSLTLLVRQHLFLSFLFFLFMWIRFTSFHSYHNLSKMNEWMNE